MENKSRKILSIVLGILIIVIISIQTCISNSLDDTFNQGREIILEDGAGLLALDPDGQPWLAASIRIKNQPEVEVRTLENGEWISLPPGKNGLLYDTVKSLAADLNGNIWVGTWQSGLRKYDGKKWTTFTAQNSGLSTNFIEDIEVDSLNRIWICYGGNVHEPFKGVTIFDGRNWSTFTTGNSDLISQEVEAIAIDPQGRVWMGMRGDAVGVSILDDGKWISYTPENSGLKADAIADIAFDAEGRAWIVTYGEVNGVNTFDGKMWEFYSPEDIGLTGGMMDWLIPAIHVDQHQRIWLSQGIIYDGQKWVGFIGEDGGIRGIGDLVNDDKGRTWLTTSDGLVILDQDYPLNTLWETRQLRMFITHGWVWYLVMCLVCLLLAVLLHFSSPLAVALLAGAFAVTGCSVLFKEPNLIFYPPFVNPGIYASAGALIGGMLGQWNKTLATKAGGKRYIPLIAGFSIGLAIGFCQLLPLLLMQ